MHLKTPGFLPRMKWSVIGLFGRVMNNNAELCSDWLFHSAAHFSSSHSYISILSLAVIASGNYNVPLLICRALKLLSNARSLFTVTFEIRDRTNLVYTMEWQVFTTHLTRSDACQWCSGCVNHSPSSSVIFPYSVYVVSEILCSVM